MSLRSLLRSVVEWIRPPHRAEPELRITPEQLRAAFAQMLADTETRRMVLRDFVGTVFPISGGQCGTPASNIDPGTFGTCAAGAREFTFEASPNSAVPLTVKGASMQSADLQRWKNNAGTVLAVVNKDGNVGVGAANPLGKLTVTNSVSGSVSKGLLLESHYDLNSGTKIVFDSLSNNGERASLGYSIVSGGGGQLFFNTSEQGGFPAAERMRITNTGSVGIGSSNPFGKLTVTDPLAGSVSKGLLLESHYDLNSGTKIVFDSLSNNGERASIGYSIVSGGGGELFFNTSPQGGVPVSERVRITSAGNVGLGTTNPQAKAAVKGRSFQATGTVSTTANSPIVTGSGSLFLSEVKVGDRIVIQSVSKTVVEVTSDTSLKAHSVYTSALSGAMTVYPNLLRIEDADGNTKALLTGDGSLVLNQTRTKQSTFGPEMITAAAVNPSDPQNRRVVLWAGAAADVEAMFLINSNGMLEWGPGGSDDQEFRLERTGVHQLNLFDAVFGIALPNDPQPRIALKNGTSPKAGEVHFGDGSVLDIILSRFSGGSPTTKGLKLAGGDLFISDLNKGVILKSPNGTCFRLKVDDMGVVSGVALTTCP